MAAGLRKLCSCLCLLTSLGSCHSKPDLQILPFVVCIFLLYLEHTLGYIHLALVMPANRPLLLGFLNRWSACFVFLNSCKLSQMRYFLSSIHLWCAACVCCISPMREISISNIFDYLNIFSEAPAHPSRISCILPVRSLLRAPFSLDHNEPLPPIYCHYSG